MRVAMNDDIENTSVDSCRKTMIYHPDGNFLHLGNLFLGTISLSS